MLQINNKTPFDVSAVPHTNLQGYDGVSVYFTASCYLANGKWHVSDKQKRAPQADEYWLDEQPSSVRYPSQLSFNKPGTDVIVNGVAIAPQGKRHTALEAKIEIANLSASVLVFGDRVWQDNRISEPQPFERMPLVWENAFGGISFAECKKSNDSKDSNGKKAEHYAYNPLGKGWVHEKHKIPEALSLPNVEWPQSLIRHPKDCPMPAGFGALPVENPVRAQYAGTYDEQWKKTRAPYAPLDFDPMFFHAAIPALRSPKPMQATEHVRIKHLHAQSELVFQLPKAQPDGSIMINKSRLPLKFQLLTIVLEPERLEVILFWQALVTVPRTMADVRSIDVNLASR